MISCNRATMLVEKKYDRGLSVGETMRLRMHTGMCSACTNYMRQSKLIDQLVKGAVMRESADDATVAAIKTQILNRLKLG